MKLATHLNYANGFHKGVGDIVDMEKAGLDLVWVPEAYGFDSPSLMGFLAARTSTVEIGASILPIFTRTPTLIAMTAAGIDNLSEGRFQLGLGASGPQVHWGARARSSRYAAMSGCARHHSCTRVRTTHSRFPPTREPA